MILPVPNLSGQIMTMLDKDTVEWSQIDELIKQWGLSIVEECAGNFECTMEDVRNMDIKPDEEDLKVVELHNGTQLYPVLVRQSILKVKNQIK